MIFSKLSKLILIGASTGGPGLIEKIIGSFKEVPHAALIIVQHMEAHHLVSFAKRLHRLNSSIAVTLVTQETKITDGNIYVLEDTSEFYFTHNTLFLQKNTHVKSYYHPQIDELFLSASKLHDIEIVTYLLSGIGADGAKGMLTLKEAHYKTVAQDEQTSIVYGMPKSAKEMGAALHVMSINEIIQDIQKESC